MSRRLLFVALFLLLPAAVLRAEEADDPQRSDGEEGEMRSSWIPPRFVHGRSVVLPKVYFSSENGLGAGVGTHTPFRLSRDPEDPLSDLNFDGRITTKGYLRGELESDLYFGEGTWSMRAKLDYQDLAYRFWGLGSDTPEDAEEVYRPRRTLAYLELFRKLGPRTRLGLRYEFEHVHYLEVEEGGLLDTMDYPGLDGRAALGLGLTASYDSRDNRYFPHAGIHAQGFVMWFDDEWGSRYDFNQYNLDLRIYRELLLEHVLAVQGFLYAARGDAPIWRYASLGGRGHSRGYRRDRYLDRTLIAFQAEYRVPFFWRLEGTLFGGLADVAPRMGKIRLETMRPTLGGGLRARIGQGHKIRARLDLAVGQGSVRVYLDLGEAF
jgi:outer membrane protein assembly factor BamA